MSELLYATSHLAGAFANPDNALGDTPATWAGVLNQNATYTSRWAIDDPADPLTPAATQTVRVTARKGSNSGTPTVALNLYEGGTLVGALLAATGVTSTTGQVLTGTFNSADVTDPAAVEVEAVEVGAGGSPSARNSAQISHIEWTADTSPAGEAGASAGAAGVGLAVTASARKLARSAGAVGLGLGAADGAEKVGRVAGALTLGLGAGSAAAKAGQVAGAVGLGLDIAAAAAATEEGSATADAAAGVGLDVTASARKLARSGAAVGLGLGAVTGAAGTEDGAAAAPRDTVFWDWLFSTYPRE